MVKKTKHTFSRRSRILRFVLDCINSRQYEDQGNYMIFGSDKDEIMQDDDRTQRSQDVDALREIHSDFLTHLGREHARRRTSIGDVPVPKRLRGLDRLSPDGVQWLSSLADEMRKRPASSGPPSEGKIIELLDAYYAQEVIGKLDSIVRRASGLHGLNPKEIKNQDLIAYFEEAHRCFLYGFQIAGAVLCRAILETALKEVVDPGGQIEKQVRKRAKPADSYFRELVTAAGSQLQDDRSGCALRVRDAGRYAIHDLSKFRTDYPEGKAAQILDDTRKVLLDLYGPAKLAEA